MATVRQASADTCVAGVDVAKGTAVAVVLGGANRDPSVFEDPDTYDIIRDGVFVDYQTTREQAPYLEWYYRKIGKPVKSHGNSYAQYWSDVQFQRMPNVSQRPGTSDTTWEDLIAATDRGIAIVGSGSFSIDQQRYNAQFGGQVFHEVRGGKIVGMLKDVAYQMRTPEFWAGMDMVGGPRSYWLGGTNGDG